MRRLLPLLLLVPLASAHVPSTPIDAEDHWLQDEWTDNGVWDGFDILDVHVREAHFPFGDGIVVRWGLYGGSSAGYFSEHLVTLEFGNAATLAWTSSDNGQSWSGPGEILDVQHATEDDLPIVNLQFQAFVSYEALGVGIGDSLDGAVASAYANDLLVDLAPGGYHLYGVEVPDPLADPPSMRLIESLALDGPDRYTRSNLSFEDGTLTIAVDNLITVTGQHLIVSSSVEPTSRSHTRASGSGQNTVTEVEAGEDVNFTLTFDELNVTRIDIRSDLGGLETFWVAGDGTIRTTPIVPTQVTPPGEESPMPVALVFGALAMAAVGVARRR